MDTTIVVNLREETKTAIADATGEEGLSTSELIDKAMQDYLFIRQFRNLRVRMMSYAGKTFTDQEVFDHIS